MENKEIKLDPTIALNYIIKTNPAVVTNEISDGYHTFGELYEHRIMLFIALAKEVHKNYDDAPVWKSNIHSDGTKFDGWFLLGIGKAKGHQITYHLPIDKYWVLCSFAETLAMAPEFDGHIAKDVLERIKTYFI